MDPRSISIARSTTRIPTVADNKKPDPTPTADERAKHLREVGDGEAVYSEIGQTDEQADVNQPEPDEHM
jgi:hypothetical protein